MIIFLLIFYSIRQKWFSLSHSISILRITCCSVCRVKLTINYKIHEHTNGNYLILSSTDAFQTDTFITAAYVLMHNTLRNSERLNESSREVQPADLSIQRVMLSSAYNFCFSLFFSELLFSTFHFRYLSHSYSIQHGTDSKIGLRLSLCLSVCMGTLAVAFLDRFSPKLAQTT